jgi:hypothetical protein
MSEGVTTDLDAARWWFGTISTDLDFFPIVLALGLFLALLAALRRNGWA